MFVYFNNTTRRRRVPIMSVRVRPCKYDVHRAQQTAAPRE